MTHEEYGEGPHAVIALHGWFGSAAAWRTVRPHLNGAEFRYVFPDYRGYGSRLHETGDHTLKEAAADVLALADRLGLERFSLVGHSMGGAVMQRVLADAPHRVRAMVGISPVPAGGVPFDDQAWALFSGAADEPANRRVIVDMTTGNRLSGVWLDAVVAHSRRHSTPAAVAGFLQAWARTDFHAEIKGNPVEVKVIVGEHDPALGADVMEATFRQWYPRCELEVLSNAGHYAIDETPVALATSVERFLTTR
ncbi:alpha/beta fold hydrolase [Streptomyces abyssomicinicus]|uniref:alpha/beta fold hydrolase n=1 Tax=Streptomyces abyssomicinicus TaxID=574929 RepID=UPI0012507C6D|nr:alpha/beta hydrolase [Streptomyces abyssomicinicus]